MGLVPQGRRVFASLTVEEDLPEQRQDRVLRESARAVGQREHQIGISRHLIYLNSTALFLLHSPPDS